MCVTGKHCLPEQLLLMQTISQDPMHALLYHQSSCTTAFLPPNVPLPHSPSIDTLKVLEQPSAYL